MQHFSSLCVVFYCCCSSFYSNHHQTRHSRIRVTELYDCTKLTIIIYRNSQYNLSICRGAHDTCSRWHFWNCTLKPRLVGWFSRAVAAAFRGGTSSRRRNNPCSSTVVLRRIIKPNDHPQILPSTACSLPLFHPHPSNHPRLCLLRLRGFQTHRDFLLRFYWSPFLAP